MGCVDVGTGVAGVCKTIKTDAVLSTLVTDGEV